MTHTIHYKGYEIDPLKEAGEDWEVCAPEEATGFRVYPSNVDLMALDAFPASLAEAQTLVDEELAAGTCKGATDTSFVCENEGTVSRQGVYTKLVSIEVGCLGFIALVKPDTDLDGGFKAFDIDNNEWLWVNGWACAIEDYQET